MEKRMNAQASLRHHRRIRRHRHYFFAAYVAAFLSLLGFSYTTITALAASTSINFSLGIGQTAPQPPIIPQPAQPITGGGAPSPILPYLLNPLTQTNDNLSLAPPPDQQLVDITINLFLSDDTTKVGETATNRSEQKTTAQITDPRPILTGSTGVPHAVIFLEFHSQIQTTTITADAKGDWTWRPQTPLELGKHDVYITVFDSQGLVKLASGVLQFEYVDHLNPQETGGGTSPKTVVKPRTSFEIPPSLLAQQKVLFDIRVKVITDKQIGEIHPGDDLFVTVSLLNIGAPGSLIDATVNYKIYDSKDGLITDESETVAVATQASYLKRFYLKPGIQPGQYSLRASVTYGDTVAVSHDGFVVIGQPEVPFAGNTKVNVSAVLLVLISIFIFALIIMYLEHHMVELLGNKLKQVSEKDLLKRGFIR